MLLVLALSASGLLHADENELERRQYSQALAALRAGDEPRFQKLRDQLADYVLLPYLDYEFLKSRIATTPQDRMHAFLEQHQDAAVSDTLRRKWLKLLSDRGDWSTFIAEYRDIEPDNELNCLRLSQLLKVSHDKSGLMNEVSRLWLTGSRLPSACEPVFQAWKQAGYLTPELTWSRIQLAMERRNLTLA